MRLTVFYTLLAMSLTIAAADCDQDKPFGFCTRTSRTPRKLSSSLSPKK